MCITSSVERPVWGDDRPERSADADAEGAGGAVKLHVVAEIGRNSADLKEFTFHSGAASDLSAFAAIKDFNNPVWSATVKGSLELKQISILAGVDGLDAGSWS